MEHSDFVGNIEWLNTECKDLLDYEAYYFEKGNK